MKRFFLAMFMSLAAISAAQGATPWGAQCIQSVSVGQVINGNLETTDCSISFDDPAEFYYTDVYAFNGTQGQRIAITMTSTNVDAWLELHTVNDRDGIPIDDDDDGGGGTNARIPANSGFITLPATGTYYISASTAIATQTGAYTFSITSAATNEFEPRCIRPIEFGQTISGTLESTDCVVTYGQATTRYFTDVYSFSGTMGQQIAIALDSREVDTWLELHTVNDVDGDPLYVGDVLDGINPRIPDQPGFYTLPATGTYYIWVNTLVPGETGPYTLKLTAATEMIATEFYHPGFDHYFITAYPEEAASLAAGNLPPWVATGKTFNVWGSSGSLVDNVWRFFSASFAPQSGHFYTNNALEAEMLERGNVWVREAADAFYMMASPMGACPDGTRALYRLYNNGMGGSPNHRYTIDPEVRAQMIAANWVPEGNGADGVFACVPF